MKQKVWLITGVSKGLGREIAKQAAEAVDIVIGTVRREENKTEFENRIDAKAFVIDLTNTEQIPSLVDSIVEQHGRIDVLVNNAGFGFFGMIEEFKEDEIVDQFNVNFISVWKMCTSVLPHMREKEQGTIVQLSSRVGITAGIGNGIYAASKFAIEGMSEALKQEVEPFGIKVLLIEPGALRTDFFGSSVKYAIISTVNNENPVFRLPLTSSTIETLKTKIVEFQNCIEATETIAKSIDY
jgi:short-subunit dehydrogenase